MRPLDDLDDVKTTTTSLHLPTLAEVNATPHATPKDQLESKLDRAIENKAFRLLDERKLRAWSLAVRNRDQWTDRKTEERLRRCLDLDPLRAEAHHVVAKDDWTVRYDIRNGLCLSYQVHEQVEHGLYRIEGTAWFTIDGATYIDCTAPVTWVRL